ncbi:MULTISPECIES: aminodeoxychorismate lyase [unclassified Acinetobacter]|uniref:aminodeoxychorismate lyase n=1 Tax=unclassified Acinetobacter TaxID=196816 RepID=UPI00293501F9|nr:MULTISPECIES: aminodeoxychorismate lyase [unclassified Acinetobacter]WOE31620.1 aminodeoxychorismate lyase [Acinetobacter sp. SAAs470]WOE37085.1 aminodeoxychorismate lyase [Acinetobacter sp. SAAs474]
MQCFKNGEQVKEISLFDRAFHYGDGCFTTACIRDGNMQLAALHMARLEWSCEKLFLCADFAVIQQTIHRLNISQPANGTLKIVVSRGDGPRGYTLPQHPADVWLFYYPADVQDFRYQIIESGVLLQRIGLMMPNLVGIKSLNRLEQVLLKHEADQQGWIEALVCDVQDTVVEGVSSNCFIRINHTWITPQLGYNGVHGVMRAEILRRMQQQGIDCQQRSVTMDEIHHIESLFFCNVLHPMKMVAQFEQRNLDVQPCIDLFNHLHLNQIY